MRIPLALALAWSLAAAAQPLPTFHDLPAPAGLARFTLPGEGLAPVPVVVMLPDATGEQGRSEFYAEALARYGIASLALGIEDESGLHAVVPASGPGAVPVALAWVAAQAPILDPGAVAVLGFGAGAQAALAASARIAVGVDPDCVGLRVAPRPRTLLLHGSAAGDAAACQARGAEPRIVAYSLRGLGHGWDLPVLAAPGSALLPHPSGEGRRRARPDPIAAEAVAELVARWVSLAMFQEAAP